MRTSHYRRAGIIGVVAATMLAGVGCDLVKVGARCKAGAAPGRDSTHLVLCQNGRWTRSITLQETANILIGILPAKAEVVAGNDQTTEAGGFFAKDFRIKVTHGDGQPSVGTQVDLTVPKTGASLDRGPRSIKTDENGVAAFLATANTVAGSYSVTAKVADRDVSTTLKFTNAPAAAKKVSLWSGGNQTTVANTDYAAPVVLKVTDAYGNVVPGVAPKVTSPDVMLNGLPFSGTFTAPAATGADGLTSFAVKAPARTGDATFTAIVNDANAASGATFALKVKPDVPDNTEISVAAGTQSAAISTAFGEPLAIGVFDQYNNPIPGLTVTYTVVPVGGAAATLSAPTAMTGTNGVASVTATANATAGAYTVQVAVLGYAPQSSLEFDLTNTP